MQVSDYYYLMTFLDARVNQAQAEIELKLRNTHLTADEQKTQKELTPYLAMLADAHPLQPMVMADVKHARQNIILYHVHAIKDPETNRYSNLKSVKSTMTCCNVPNVFGTWEKLLEMPNHVSSSKGKRKNLGENPGIVQNP